MLVTIPDVLKADELAHIRRVLEGTNWVDGRATAGRPLVEVVERCLGAGLPAVQLREKDVTAVELLDLARALRRLTARHGARLLVNDRVDVAITSGAHGVHLRSDSMPASRVRAVAPPGFLVGRSVHSSGEAARLAEEGGLDYLMFGSVFETSSKPGRPVAGVDGLAEAVAAARTLAKSIASDRVAAAVLAIGALIARYAGSWRWCCGRAPIRRARRGRPSFAPARRRPPCRAYSRRP